MCGIVGIWNPTATPDAADVARMHACLAHRGPDAEGTYVDGPVGLGHRRLAIIDPTSGDQPVFNEDGDVAVVFNGEIYNYRALRDDLESAGHRFTTGTDTEVLVHLYEERGPDFVAALDGMFAFALYDRTAGRLVLARDQFGIKPLIIARMGDRLAFASELPALFEAPVSLGGIDQKAIGAYFGLGFIPAPLTAFQNAQKLRAGERLVVDGDGLDRTCFGQPTIRARDPGIDAAATELRTRLSGAVEKRLMSDVPLGAFLSGGIDSSVVVGLLSELVDDPVRTFTVGFEEAQFDESWAGRAVADHFGTDHTEFTCSPAAVRDLVSDVLSRLGEPFADPSLLPTYIIARETSSEVTVALSGDGGDELFAGYGKYRGEYLSEYYRQLPRSVRRGLVEPVIDRLPASRGSRRGELARKLRKFTEGGEPDLVRRHFGWLRVADDAALEAVKTSHDPRTVGVESLRDSAAAVRSSLPDSRQDSLTMVQAIDTRHSLPDQLLAKVDLASMYNALEVRVPFLDPGVVEYAFSLPRSYVMGRTERKRLLRRTFADDLPDSVLDRSKQGFDMPIGEWFKGPLAADFETAVSTLETDLLDERAVMTAYDDHCAGRTERAKFLWSVYVFAHWHRRLRNRGVI
jgi:asparagine synthase (glutamine-hydrolysing)